MDYIKEYGWNNLTDNKISVKILNEEHNSILRKDFANVLGLYIENCYDSLEGKC